MRKLKPYLLIFLLISLLCTLAYFNSLANPFIWDDQALVVDNPLVRHWQNIPKAFSSDLYFGVASGSNFYRPLQTISFIFDYQFWQLNPFGYHLTNILLQIGVAFLVFLLINQLLANFAIAISTALLFALTPLHTESVAYISGRAEMLMGFFAILALLLFIKSQNRQLKHPRAYFYLSIISFKFALFSKELAIVFPLIIFGYVFYLQREKLKEKFYCLKNIFPFVTMALIYLFLRLSVFHFVTLRPPALAKISWTTRLVVLPEVIFTYFKLFFLPTGLHMNRELLRPSSYLGILLAVFALGVIIFTCLYFLRTAGKHKVGAFMLFWALVFFIPQSGIFPINAFLAEHFIYLPVLSFFLLVVYFLQKVLRPKAFIIVISLLCVFYILLTSARNFQWRHPVVFYQNIIKYSPASFQAHNNLGLEYQHLERFADAQREYERALEIKPDLIEARANLANLYFMLKLYTQAQVEYELLEKMDLGTKAGQTQNNLGNVYEAQGKLEEAALRYLSALKLDPTLKFTHFNLARIYFTQAKFSLGVAQILDSLALANELTAPQQAALIYFIKSAGTVNNAEEFYNNLGIYFARNNLFPAAVQAFGLSIELNPRFADAYFNQGLAYLYMGKKSEARLALKQVLKIVPNHIGANRLIAQKLL